MSYLCVCCRKKIRKFFVKGKERKLRSDGKLKIIINFINNNYHRFCPLGRHGSSSGSEEDLSPEHDQQSVKVRATLLCMVGTNVPYTLDYVMLSRVGML